MKKLGTILANINSFGDDDKFLSREFQKYGLFVAEQLGDMTHKALYIKMAKNYPREVLANALTFVLDAHAKSSGALFMWKVKQLLLEKQKK